MEDNKFKISDFGILVTIGGILLYSLGWIYLQRYYDGLNIDVSFIDLSIDRVIATTWIPFICLITILILCYMPFYFLHKKQNYTINNKILNFYQTVSISISGIYIIAVIYVIIFISDIRNIFQVYIHGRI